MMISSIGMPTTKVDTNVTQQLKTLKAIKLISIQIYPVHQNGINFYSLCTCSHFEP